MTDSHKNDLSVDSSQGTDAYHLSLEIWNKYNTAFWSDCRVFRLQLKYISVWSCSLNLSNLLWLFRGVFHSCLDMLTRSYWILPQPPAIAFLLITQSTLSKWHNLKFSLQLTFFKSRFIYTVFFSFLYFKGRPEKHKSPFKLAQALSHDHFSPIKKKKRGYQFLNCLDYNMKLK